MQLRICFPSGPRAAYGKDFNSDGYARKLSGTASEILMMYLGGENLSRRHNVSFLYLPSKSGGSDMNGSGIYDGCVGAMQRGKADVAAMVLSFPVVAANLTQGPALTQYEGYFISAYKPTAVLSAPDLLDYFSALSSGTSTMYLLASLTLGILLWLSLLNYGRVRPLKSRRDSCRRKKKRPLSFYLVIWIMMSNMLGNFHSNARFRKTRILFALLIFLTFMYRIQSNLVMKTEQVIATPPVKLRSIEQLFDRKITFAFISDIEYEIFRESAITDMKKMVDASLLKGLENVVLKRLVSRENNKKLIQGILLQKHVLTTERAQKIMTALCWLADRHKIDMGNHIMIRTRLKNSPHPLGGIIMSQRFREQNPEAARILVRAIRISVTESMLPHGYSASRFSSIRTALRVKKVVTDCYKRIGEPEPDMKLFTPGIRNLKRLLFLSAFVLILAIISLMIEIARVIIVRRWNKVTRIS